MSLISAPTDLRAGDEAARCACEYGPLATRRKRVSLACHCAAWTIGPWTSRQLRKLLEAGRAYADRTATLADVLSAVAATEAEIAAEARRTRSDVFTIFEGLRAGSASGATRGTRAALDAVGWAIGTHGAAPHVPPNWDWAHAALAALPSAPVCEPEWRTSDVLALANFARTGTLGVLPILADALQDAGCENDVILGHCRTQESEHAPGCWVPDLILGD